LADFPFFEETVLTVFFEEVVFFADEAVLGAAFFGSVLPGTLWLFFVGVGVFDCGSASDPASAVRKKSVKPYFMSNKKGAALPE